MEASGRIANSLRPGIHPAGERNGILTYRLNGKVTGSSIQHLTRELWQSTPSRIVLLVADGLGGIQAKSGEMLTELEHADTPHLDALAVRSITGLHQPINPGITVGSGPGHLALFGYDPLEYRVGRGVLASLGVNLDLRKEDVAARGNFCTVDEKGNVIDRRAGRISDEEGKRLVERLEEIRLENDDVEVFVEHVKQYRFALILRGKKLGSHVSDTDPQQTGVKPAEPEAVGENSETTAKLIGEFLEKAGKVLRDEEKANMLLLRSFSKRPDIPSMKELYGLNAAAIAVYPMYRGVSRLVGMSVQDTGSGLGQEMGTLRECWEDHDFFFVHFKDPDSSGEDRDFRGKARKIEELGSLIPEMLKLEPDVLIVTGDHSTPSALESHSWHPVPVLLSAKTCRRDSTESFGERECLRGGLGQFPTTSLMPLALAHAGKLRKFDS